MLEFVLVVLFLSWASRTVVGYRVERFDKSDPEYYGYDSNDLDDVIEYYEQKKCGYLDMLDDKGGNDV